GFVRSGRLAGLSLGLGRSRHCTFAIERLPDDGRIVPRTAAALVEHARIRRQHPELALLVSHDFHSVPPAGYGGPKSTAKSSLAFRRRSKALVRFATAP